MNRYILGSILVCGLSIASCAKKTDTTQIDSSSSNSTNTAVTDATDTSRNSGMSMNGGMKMTGQIDEDMAMMGKMMMMKLGAADKDYDDRFIGMMIPHHEGAVMMAKDALTKTSKPELKKLAQEIIASQNKEIDQMQKWDQQWYGHPPATSAEIPMMTQMVQELGPAGKDYEDHFIDGMIPHHESAIAMANDALVKSSHPEIKALAKNIVASQQKEIDQMKALRKAWYGH